MQQRKSPDWGGTSSGGRWCWNGARCRFPVRVVVETADQDQRLLVTVVVTPCGSRQVQQLLRHCSPHRHCGVTVAPALLGRWRRLQQLGDHDGALALQQPAVVLWDQVCFTAAADGSASWQCSCADGLIARGLIERLRWCDGFDDLLLNLQQLELENRLSDRWRADSGDDDAFHSGSDRVAPPALLPAPVRLEPGSLDRPGSSAACP